jgi:hypothetical protein
VHFVTTRTDLVEESDIEGLVKVQQLVELGHWTQCASEIKHSRLAFLNLRARTRLEAGPVHRLPHRPAQRESGCRRREKVAASAPFSDALRSTRHSPTAPLSPKWREPPALVRPWTRASAAAGPRRRCHHTWGAGPGPERRRSAALGPQPWPSPWHSDSPGRIARARLAPPHRPPRARGEERAPVPHVSVAHQIGPSALRTVPVVAWPRPAPLCSPPAPRFKKSEFCTWMSI